MMKQILIGVLWLLSGQLLAQKTLVLFDKQEEYVLEENILVYQDSTRSLRPQTVLTKTFPFSSVNPQSPNFKTSDFWIKLEIKNESSHSTWLLEILDFGIQEVAFYDVEKGVFIETGYARRFDTRAHQHKNFIFDLSVTPHKSQTYLLKLSSRSYFGPILKVRSFEQFSTYSNNEYLLLGFYYGLLILIASYNLFLFISIRELSHLYYVAYVISVGLRSLQGDGLGFQYGWPSFPLLNDWLIFSPQLLLITFSVYAIHFLDLRNQYPFPYRWIVASLIFYFLVFFIDRFIQVDFIMLVYLIPFLLIYGFSIYIYSIKKFKPARFFVLGYSFFIISQIAYFLITSGLHLENVFLIVLLVYSLNIGFVVESYVFSIALVDKVKWFKREKELAQQHMIDQLKINEELKDKVNQELEWKVQERTRELEESKKKVQEQAEKINSMNQLLDLENYTLKSNVKAITRDRGLLKVLSLEEFMKAFPDENACYRFIEELKWGDHFACHKCGNSKYANGKNVFSRQCSKCRYIETIKANTIFHNLKFPIEKAFQIIYLTLISEEDISTYALAHTLNLQQKTCWAFRQKILAKIEKEGVFKKDLMEKGWGILIKE